jgi:hypothetical protein
MAEAWIDVPETKRRLARFFRLERDDFSRFGSTVNQVFEAYVFAQVVSSYRQRAGWAVQIVNPNPNSSANVAPMRLKFSTRGRPSNYSYAKCTSPKGEVFQVRHQLRVATRHHKSNTFPPANVCLDVAVISNLALDGYSTNDYVANPSLVTFGEAKHMSAFAELVAGFIGLVYEMQPRRLKRIRVHGFQPQPHPAPFLFVSGFLWRTAEGLVRTMIDRKFDVDVYTRDTVLSSQLPLP